jgi:P-type Cu2+ transporter
MTAVAGQSAYALWNDKASGRARAVFAAQGIHCAGCGRKIERAVGSVPGVAHVDVNVATARVCVDWDAARADLTGILRAVSHAGFRPVPLGGDTAAVTFARERREALKRIGLAGLGMMQVMMYVLGVYVARPESIDPAVASYLRYVALLITTPVLLYSGAPFFSGALRDLRQRTFGMDVPVALALSLAYAASVFNTVRGTGQTYFDSVTMFIFFLSAGRYVEMAVRQQSLSLSEAVARSLPSRVSRIKADGTTEPVALERIVAGDRIFLPKGGVVPVDAELAEGEALLDESLVTGESKSERRRAGDVLLGGALNVGGPIRLVARHDVSSSTLASIVALLERAQAVRPPIARAADRIANGFIAAILLVAIVVALAWVYVDAARAFPAVLAVLVVTCPCALSLATPVAVAAASTRLARSGLLVTRADALERLAQVDTVVLDKTGTLTSGEPSVVAITVDAALTEERALAIAAALERGSAHPLAAAFTPHAGSAVVATNLAEHAGRGIEGQIDGTRWRLGKLEFVDEMAGATRALSGEDGLFLGSATGERALFDMGETIRPDARGALDAFRSLGIGAVMASGDRQDAVLRAARALGIKNARSRLTPADKTELVRSLQARGQRVLMLGDGVNDGPVLATSNVSCAMARGSAIAQAAADFLLLNDSLDVVAKGIVTARRMREVIRQNLQWAVLYNLVAVPLAALNLVPPWLAALGMSASSLVVVLNARRLARAST